MKHLFSLLLLCSIAFCVHSQVSKTVDVVTPGTLGRNSFDCDWNAVTNLTVTGSIDARDFKFIRDSMLSIAVVDFGATRIMAYEGFEGTSPEDSVYSANEVPKYAFLRTDEYADRSYLKKVVVSRTATSIGETALALCTSLDSIRISSAIKKIRVTAFTGSSAVISVDPDNTQYRDTLGMLFDKSLDVLYYCPITKQGDCVLPSTLDTIDSYAFYGCTELISIELPKSVVSLGSYSFFNCSGLNSLKVNNAPNKISLGEDAFYKFRTDTCILYVPYGRVSQFRMADQWDAFRDIREHSTGLVTNLDFVNLLNGASSETIFVRSNVNWTVQSDQSWLNLDKTFSLNSDTVVVSADTNTTNKNRVAHLVFSADGIEPLTLTVTQSAPEVHLSIESGGLANSLKVFDQRNLMMLRVDGTMDIRDFLTLNDSLPMLTSVDLTDVRVTAWKISGFDTYSGTYLANTLPYYAFNGSYSPNVSVISRVILPNSIQTIDNSAFEFCTALKEISIPDSVTTIGYGAFLFCTSLKTLILGKSVNRIGDNSFTLCFNLNTIWLKSEDPIVFDEQTDVFDRVDISKCKLHVPFGTTKRYAAAPIWKEFESIVEDPTGFLPEVSVAKIAHSEGSMAKVYIRSTVPWTVQKNQSWFQVNPSFGSGNDTLVITAQANLQTLIRKAEVVVSTLEFGARTIQVTQDAFPKTIQMKAGELSVLLTSQELKSLSNLTLKGTMDARDFLILRDSMPLLNMLDISDVSILKYEGGNATSYSNIANAIPDNAFYDKYKGLKNKELESVILPQTITSIGELAFACCQNLKNVSIPDQVQSISADVFLNCISLTSIVLPKSLKTLGYFAFFSCTNLTEIQMGDSLIEIGTQVFKECKSLKSIDLPESIQSIGNEAFSSCTSLTEIVIPRFVKKIQSAAFSSCTSLTRIVMNNQLQFIGTGAFSDCTKLAEINLPGSVNTIEYYAFSNCPSLRTVFVNAILPSKITLLDNVFNRLNFSLCTLHVPYQTKALYLAADQWKDFGTILEAPYGLSLNTNLVNLSEKAGSFATVLVTSNTAWTVHSDQDWLTVSKNAGSGVDSLRLNVQGNSELTGRSAIVTFLAEGVEPQTVEVSQEATMKIVTIAAGGLSSALSAQEKQTLTKLTITGVMDARDFKVLRDNIPNLTQVYMGQTTVAAYAGTAGTKGTWNDTYPSNMIPDYAFSVPYIAPMNQILQKVELPSGITAIGRAAFAYCRKLEGIQLPLTVNTIGYEAFEECRGLKRINFPEGITALIDAFGFCISLESIDIPSSVTSITSEAFSSCSGLKSITIRQRNPPYINDYWTFWDVDRFKCVLYVPAGSKELYASAYVWMDFAQIVEMENALDKNSQSSVILTPNPFTDVIRIHGLMDAAQLTILDVKGQLLLTKWVTNDQSISTEGLAKGAYLVLLKTSRGSITQKLIKN